jgi:hypothetical protein
VENLANCGEIGQGDELVPDKLDRAGIAIISYGSQIANWSRTVTGDFQADLLLDSLPAGQQALGTTTIAGDLTGATWQIHGGIQNLTVGGVADTSTIRTTGNIAKITVGQANAFDVLAGAKAAIVRHATAAPADFDNMAAVIGSYTIKGRVPALLSDLYFQNSNISAPSIGTVSLLNVKWDNALTSFGIWADQITKVQYASKPYGVKWTWPWAPGEFHDMQDLKIQLI